MGTIDPDRWQALDAYLDQALEFDDDQERAAWLASVRSHSPQIASDLERLLARQEALVDERFLERQIVPRPVQPAAAGQRFGS